MNFETIRYDVDEGIALLTLNRPDQLNAYNVAMMHEVIAAFDLIDADDDVRAVIVTGAGKAFCAGADIAGGSAGFLVAPAGSDDASPSVPIDYASEIARDGGGRATLRVAQCLKPVIAAINGAAVGFGATFVLPMDIRLASEDARFGFVFARRGIVPESASAYFLPRLVGIQTALEWCYSGEIFPATEALAAGLIKEILPRNALMPAALALARRLVNHSSPVSIALTRQLMWKGLGFASPMDAHRVDSRCIVALASGPDAAEGVQSFLEKRPARFASRVSSDMPDFFPWWDEERYA